MPNLTTALELLQNLEQALGFESEMHRIRTDPKLLTGRRLKLYSALQDLRDDLHLVSFLMSEEFNDENHAK